MLGTYYMPETSHPSSSIMRTSLQTGWVRPPLTDKGAEGTTEVKAAWSPARAWCPSHTPDLGWSEGNSGIRVTFRFPERQKVTFCPFLFLPLVVPGQEEYPAVQSHWAGCRLSLNPSHWLDACGPDAQGVFGEMSWEPPTLPVPWPPSELTFRTALVSAGDRDLGGAGSLWRGWEPGDRAGEVTAVSQAPSPPCAGCCWHFASGINSHRSGRKGCI